MAITSVPRGTAVGRYIKSLLIAKGDFVGARGYAMGQAWDSTPQVLEALKGAIAPVDSSEPLTLPAALSLDFIELMRPQSIVGRLTGMARVPFNTRTVTQIGGASASFVGEGRPIPASPLAFADGVTLKWLKVAGLSIVTQELVRNSTPGVETILSADLAKACAQALDLALIDPTNAGDAWTPAAITFGAPSIVSSGSTVAAFDADLKAALDLLDPSLDLSTASWVMRPSTAVHLSLLRSGGALAYPFVTARGGTLAGLPVITSSAIGDASSPSEAFIALVIGSEVLIADDNQSLIESSEEAALVMDSAPGAGPQSVTSLWQHGLVCMKGIRAINWQARRPGGVAIIGSVQV